MSVSLEEQIQQRRANLAELQKLGVETYPRRFERRHTISGLVDAYGGRTHDELEADRIETITAGRNPRDSRVRQSELSWCCRTATRRCRSTSGRIRCRSWISGSTGCSISATGSVSRDVCSAPRPTSSRSGRRAFTSSASVLLPLPEKWHGLTDVEIRYRQRYLDLIVNPDSRRVFETRSKVTTSIRAFMTARGYLEVETPMMQPIAGGAIARPFVTHHNTLDMPLYLRIAPELYLKRLTVGGLERVFEINRNFRNEGISTQHNPEFTMLEFYEGLRRLSRVDGDDRRVIATVAKEAVGSDQVTFGDHQISLTPPFARVSLRDGRSRGGLAPAAPRGDRCGAQVARPRDGAGDAARTRGRSGARRGKITATIFEALCEAGLVQPTFVYDFPTEVSPLSKQKPDDPDTVERFELYIGGFEVANAFSELNDPAEQRRRFEAQLTEPRGRRPRGARHGRGLHSRPRVRAAADRRGRGRYRSAGDAADQQPVDSGRDPVSADA
jgi:lysyl-tRNA synthetase class 2